MQKTNVEPMPEVFRYRVRANLVLELAKHHPRGRTMAFWIVHRKLVRVVTSARA